MRINPRMIWRKWLLVPLESSQKGVIDLGGPNEQNEKMVWSPYPEPGRTTEFLLRQL